jgi:hypothetical protein
VKECVEAGLDSLKFSLNAADREQYWKITGVDGFDKVVQNIKGAWRAMEESGSRCGLYVSSILYDENFAERMRSVLVEIAPFIDEHYWLPLYGQAGLTANARNILSVAGNIGRIGALRESLPCWAVFTEGHITYDGFLSACCFDHDGRFHMADLKEQPFPAAWHSAKFQALRRAHIEKNIKGTACEECFAH